MAYTFDGANKIVSISLGTTAMDVKDFYSRWKDWIQSEGSNYLQTCSVVGGDPIDVAAGVYVSTYIFLENGWRIRPAEESHTLKVYNGILLTAEGDDPFIVTIGSYNVQVKYSQPVATQTVIVETGVSGLTSAESTELFGITPSVTGSVSEQLAAQTTDLTGDFDARIVAQTALLVSYMKNKKYLSKEGSVWYLIIRNDSNTDDILKKALKDKDGNNISDIEAGTLAQELASSV